MKQMSILIVEDEALIRMMLGEMIEELGHTVVAEAGSVAEGRSLADTEDYDLAILDINLHGENVLPVAEVVSKRKLPFLFLSGYGARGVPNGFEGAAVLSKPCTVELLKRAIDAAISTDEPERAQDKNGARL